MSQVAKNRCKATYPLPSNATKLERRCRKRALPGSDYCGGCEKARGRKGVLAKLRGPKPYIKRMRPRKCRRCHGTGKVGVVADKHGNRFEVACGCVEKEVAK